MVTGLNKIDGKNYKFNDNGTMATGWININGAWYKLKDSGAITTGWVTSNGDSYYLDPSTGRMLTNIVIDGYKISSDGKKQASSTANKSDNDGTNNSSNGKIKKLRLIIVYSVRMIIMGVV